MKIRRALAYLAVATAVESWDCKGGDAELASDAKRINGEDRRRTLCILEENHVMGGVIHSIPADLFGMRTPEFERSVRIYTWYRDRGRGSGASHTWRA